MHELNIDFPELNKAGEYEIITEDLEADMKALQSLSTELDELNASVDAFTKNELRGIRSTLRSQAYELEKQADAVRKELENLQDQYSKVYRYYDDDGGIDYEERVVADKAKQQELAEQERELEAEIEKLQKEYRELEDKAGAEEKEISNRKKQDFDYDNKVQKQKDLHAAKNNTTKALLNNNPEVKNDLELAAEIFADEFGATVERCYVYDVQGNNLLCAADFKIEPTEEYLEYNDDNNAYAKEDSFRYDIEREINSENRQLEKESSESLIEDGFIKYRPKYIYHYSSLDEPNGYIKVYPATWDEPSSSDVYGDESIGGEFELEIILQPFK